MNSTDYDRIRALLDTRFPEICRILREKGNTEDRICLWQDFMQAGMSAAQEFDAARHGEWELFILEKIQQTTQRLSQQD
jgi:hypothetical protein